MNTKSVENALKGIGKLRAASVAAGLVPAATLLSIHVSSAVQSAGLVALGLLLAAVNVADGVVRSGHLKALPALVEKDAAEVASSTDETDPKLSALAESVETVAARVDGLERRPNPPSVQEIIAALTEKRTPVVPEPAPVVPAATPAPDPTAAPSAPAAEPTEVVSTPTPAPRNS